MYLWVSGFFMGLALASSVVKYFVTNECDTTGYLDWSSEYALVCTPPIKVEYNIPKD